MNGIMTGSIDVWGAYENRSSLLNYVCGMQCYSGKHSKKKWFQCEKECEWICAQCYRHSRFLKWAYQSHYSYLQCIHHYIYHYNVLIHHCSFDFVTLYNISSKERTIRFINRNLRKLIESISFNGKIYTMGDGDCSGEVFEVCIITNSLKQKANMLKGKYEHGLCLAQGCIYSICGFDGHEKITDCQKFNVACNK